MQGLLTTVHFQKCNLQYQAFAFFEIVPSAPITMGIIVSLVSLWILLISRAIVGLHTFPPFPPQ